MNSGLLPFYLIDTFVSDIPGSGNPAAVCLLNRTQTVSMKTMSYGARYFGQDETIFAKEISRGVWDLRWYTPDGFPIAPGGNGTVALASLLLNTIEPELDQIQLLTNVPGLSSTAWRSKTRPLITSVALPLVLPRQIEPDSKNRLIQAFGPVRPSRFLSGEQDLIIVFDEQCQVSDLEPDYDLLFNLPYRAFIATAKGDYGGFVVRTFITGAGKQRWECPGSARALMNLTSFWSGILTDVGELHVQHLSERGGEAWCSLDYRHDHGAAVIVSARCEKRAGPFLVSFEVGVKPDESLGELDA